LVREDAVTGSERARLAGHSCRLTVKDLGTIATSPAAPGPLTRRPTDQQLHHRSPPMTSPNRAVTTSRADVTTGTPDRYVKQLVAHLGRKLDFNTEGATSTTTIGEATGQIVVGDGQLTLIATGVDTEAVARVEHVLGSHLERFGQRNELTVTWTRTTTPPAVAD
jgi:hypothetical protein